MLGLNISKINSTIAGFAGLCVLLATPMAFASTQTGQIETLRINTNNSSSPRVSIDLAGTQPPTSCTGAPSFYAYNGAVNGVGLLRTKGLLAAYESDQQVTIVGTGSCDPFGVETIDYIDLK